MSTVGINGIAETQANMSQLVRLLAKDPHHHPIVMGSHHIPKRCWFPLFRAAMLQRDQRWLTF